MIGEGAVQVTQIQHEFQLVLKISILGGFGPVYWPKTT